MTELQDTFVLDMVELAFPDEARRLGDLPWVQVNIPGQHMHREHIGCYCNCQMNQVIRRSDIAFTIELPTVRMKRMEVREVDGLEDEDGNGLEWVTYLGQCARCYKVFYAAEPAP